jgi:hypothetical protein
VRRCVSGTSDALAAGMGNPLPFAIMGFRPEDLRDFEHVTEVRLETHVGGGKTRSTVVWVVVDNGQVFVRALHGTRGRWYQDALTDPDVTIDDDGRRLETRAVPVHDEDSIRRTSEGLKRKYADDAAGLASMLTPAALEGTLRLDPRTDQERSLQAPAYLGQDNQSGLGPPIDVSLLDAGPAVDESVILQPHKPI